MVESSEVSANKGAMAVFGIDRGEFRIPSGTSREQVSTAFDVISKIPGEELDLTT